MATNFISYEKFEALAVEKQTIQKWETLEIGEIYQVIAVDEIATKGITNSGVFAKLMTRQEAVIATWITPIIHEELKKYKQFKNNVYIKPLGSKISKETGYPYQDFTIVMDH